MIKPKSRKHEDRIKELEARPYFGAASFDRIYRRIANLENKIAELQRPWYKRMFGL